MKRKCNHCGLSLPRAAFASYAPGKLRKQCRFCYAEIARKNQFGRGETPEMKENRRFTKLMKTWTVALVVVAIYSHDYIDGRNRICFYDSMYGSHAITIDAMRMCPMTIEVDE